MDTKLLSSLSDILLSFPEYWEQEELQKYKVIEDLKKYRADLIKALLADEQIRRSYTLKVGGATVFKLDELVSAFRYKNYWEYSYTKYTNKIGLTSEGRYLDYNSDVVLDFPHKDCILEGGMSTEDVGQEEIYYNKVIAKGEVDMLTAPKAFKNIKKYDKSGSKEVTEINDTDNLIIKGNNLLALHSLKEGYVERVKLIYIDPPYNTGNDGFKYNDKFNQSTWLTFMKNRLEIARELLTDDGSIWINIDDGELHYLKVLCDEIFGRENFIANIIWKKKFSPQNDAKYLSDMHDHILLFAKNRENFRVNGLPRTEEMDSRYSNLDNDSRGPWTSGDLSVKRLTPKDIYPIVTPSGREVMPPSGSSWRFSECKIQELIDDNRIWFGEQGKNVPRLKRFLSNVKQTVTPQTIWDYTEVGHNQSAVQNLKEIFNASVFDTPKPEKLLERIIHIGSDEKDLVLDFFMGSSTTQAVAHKMNRQYIGIEQMDYINEVSVPRLQKVIEGEQGGISNDVDWQGGGSFIYAELYDLNNEYIAKIRKAKNQKELNTILDKIKTSAYLNFKVELNKITTSDEEFQALSLEDQRRVLIDLLDMNQLYLNYSEISDSQYGVSGDVKKFNDSFYQKGDLDA